MADRKTIDRKVLIEKVNKCMKSDFLSTDEKLTIADFVENVLIAGKSYKGYYEASNEDLGMTPYEERRKKSVHTREYF